MKKMEIKFNWIDALIVALILPLVVGIILILVNEWVKEPETPDSPIAPVDIIGQLKSLQNPNAPFAIAMWINTPGKTQFTTEDKVALYYKVTDLPKDELAYFSLFNISAINEVSHFVLNKPIKGDNIYSVPEPQTTLASDAPLLEIVPELALEKGREYFRAIVTLDEIAPEKLMTAPKKALEQTTWGTESLTVQVVPK
jgi:hypothetical protein